MIDAPATTPDTRSEQLLASMTELRPELHRYCARLTGSIFDGEDLVQDVLVRALASAQELKSDTPLRPWLFRIAHNRAIDFLRSRTVRSAASTENVLHLADASSPDPEELLARQQAVGAALSCFIELPIAQRSTVILKDVLDYSLDDIASLLDMSVDAVKAALGRGRQRLKEIGATTSDRACMTHRASTQAELFASLFNRREWDTLRSLLADDVRLMQATRPERVGREEVGMFFTYYARWPEVLLAPARLADEQGTEVIAVLTDGPGSQPQYLMKIDWCADRIVRIRDFRYARYVIASANLSIALRR